MNDFIIHKDSESGDFTVENLDNYRIIIAEDILAEKYEKEIDQILESMGYPNALVTDLSQFFDFTLDPNYGENENENEIKEIAEKNDAIMQAVRSLVGDESIKESDKIVHAAEILYKKLNNS